MNHKCLLSTFVALGFIVLTAPAGCDAEEGPGPDFGGSPAQEPIDSEQVPQTCAGSSIDSTSAAKTGIAQLDTFFEAVAQLRDVADKVSAQAAQTIGQLGETVGASVDAASSLPDQATAVAMEVEGIVGGQVHDGLGLLHQTAACMVSGHELTEAAAACEGEAAGAEATPMCGGSCLLDSESELPCEAELSCEGPALDPECSGECTGSCVEVMTVASCDGTCTGVCTGSCDGGVPGATMDCAGLCDGGCTGSCETDLPLGGSCEGQCVGSCAWEPVEDSCGDVAVPVCTAEPGSEIECIGSCSGTLDAAGVSPECAATVAALANSTADCQTPEIVVDPSFADGVDVPSQEELTALGTGMTPSYGELLATAAQAQHILDSAFAVGGMLDGVDVLQAFGQQLIDSDPEATASTELECALEQLARTQQTLEDIQSDLQATVQASATITASVSASTP